MPLLRLLLVLMFTVSLARAADSLDQVKLQAEKGDARAQYDLGLAYESGKGAPKNATEAFQWFLKAAEQGNIPAENKVAVMYAHGTGVTMDEPAAIRWFLKAADQRDATAEYNLGNMNYKGHGVPKNEVEGCAWWTVAAAGGHTRAAENLKNAQQTMTPEQIAQAAALAKERMEKYGPKK